MMVLKVFNIVVYLFYLTIHAVILLHGIKYLGEVFRKQEGKASIQFDYEGVQWLRMVYIALLLNFLFGLLALIFA